MRLRTRAGAHRVWENRASGANSGSDFFRAVKKHLQCASTRKKRTLAFGLIVLRTRRRATTHSTHRPPVVHLAFEASQKVRRAGHALEPGVLRSIEPHGARSRRELNTRAVSRITRGSVRASSRGPNDANTRPPGFHQASTPGFPIVSRARETRGTPRARVARFDARGARARAFPSLIQHARTHNNFCTRIICVCVSGGDGSAGTGPSVGSRDRTASPTSSPTRGDHRERPGAGAGGRDRARGEVFASDLPGVTDPDVPAVPAAPELFGSRHPRRVPAKHALTFPSPSPPQPTSHFTQSPRATAFPGLSTSFAPSDRGGRLSLLRRSPSAVPQKTRQRKHSAKKTKVALDL